MRKSLTVILLGIVITMIFVALLLTGFEHGKSIANIAKERANQICIIKGICYE